ncbi:hypothetical protein [Streptomyces uncialis]|uniref:hypothetical protein n=1 Tax=Streptomyces uncialis TaxID=1048205 RepID=UPI003869382D|nr:hypothetical protein OG924_12625 [Streptomyces uncialis]
MNTEIRSQFASMFAAWSTYTPSWTGATTNPVLGDGTLIGLYMKIGRTVSYHINLTSGATTTYGAGALSFALPAAAASRGASYIGNAHLLQGGVRYTGHHIVSPGATTAGPSFPTSSGVSTNSLWAQGTPIVLAAGAQVRITGQYESAA